MRLFTLLIVLSAALLVGFAPAPFPRTGRTRSEEGSVYGKWEFTLWEMNGNKSEASQYLEFTQGKVDFVSLRGGGKVTYDFIVRQDLTPRGFLWKPGGGTGWVGSFRVERDTLTMIFKSGADLNVRPTDFNATHEYRFILKRMR